MAKHEQEPRDESDGSNETGESRGARRRFLKKSKQKGPKRTVNLNDLTLDSDGELKEESAGDKEARRGKKIEAMTAMFDAMDGFFVTIEKEDTPDDEKESLNEIITGYLNEIDAILKTGDELSAKEVASWRPRLKTARTRFSKVSPGNSEDKPSQPERSQSGNIEGLLQKIRTGIHFEITSKSNYTIERKLEIINLIQESIKEARGLIAGLPQEEQEAYTKRLNKLEQSYAVISENTKKFAEKQKTKKPKEEKVETEPAQPKIEEVEKPAKAPVKKTVEAKEYRSNEVSMLFAEINSALFDDQLDLKDYQKLAKKSCHHSFEC